MQLSNLASDRYLGTYTGKILAVQANYREKPGNNMEVAERHDVFVLELPAWHEERRRDETGKLIWTSAELEEFKKALEYVFGPESRGQ
jgi:benzoyl-CoA reductase/2-hydroxyglutaryl-CoA dehydratase subunit BcrC/BadD/HgdB